MARHPLSRACIPKLAAALGERLPGEEAHRNMAVKPRILPPGLWQRTARREGAVIMLLYPVDEQLHLPLTVRSRHLRDHSGQISLPGGRSEPGDISLWETAVRETQEEVGIDPDAIVPLGRLTPVEIPVSGFVVHPFVGHLAWRPRFQLQTAEVEGLIELPLHVLLDPAARDSEIWELHGQRASVPFYRYEDHVIWGATAMMLHELEVILDRVSQDCAMQ